MYLHFFPEGPQTSTTATIDCKRKSDLLGYRDQRRWLQLTHASGPNQSTARNGNIRPTGRLRKFPRTRLALPRHGMLTPRKKVRAIARASGQEWSSLGL